MPCCLRLLAKLIAAEGRCDEIARKPAVDWSQGLLCHGVSNQRLHQLHCSYFWTPPHVSLAPYLVWTPSREGAAAEDVVGIRRLRHGMQTEGSWETKASIWNSWRVLYAEEIEG